jgi:GT2 family glycosyltransferase
MKTFDIVVPHCNVPRVIPAALLCVRSIRECSQDYRVIWIQNGGECPPAIDIELRLCEKCLTIMNPRNLGFVKATNQGIRASDAPYVVLMNNDARAATGWLRKLRAPLLSSGIGISGPLSTASGSWQGRMRPRQNPWIVPDDLNLAFFCAMIRRDVIEQIGLLDEAFGPGLGDDDDYSIRARAAGYRLALVTDLRIQHDHRSTFRELYSREQIRSIQQAAVRRIKSNRIAPTAGTDPA